ncbi:MAG TPA: 4a-hydroxytetrahydrobiopterin dehydratase [Chloroflexi bacterium]|nr:MAG: 4a-hydroxytetrahydrobiopterin dehydratase [Chloroflexota bacterium]HDD55654.1 4a-hydroxytetrahydrobiopterin dehydratase [Chloroflexota bacterium]
MSDLADRICQPPRKGDRALSETEIAGLLPSLPDWCVVERDSIPRLERSYQFPDFKEALGFANLVGELAEKEDHHPAVLISWGRAAVSWWTFSIDGLHENDFILAARTDLLFQDKNTRIPSRG